MADDVEFREILSSRFDAIERDLAALNQKLNDGFLVADAKMKDVAAMSENIWKAIMDLDSKSDKKLSEVETKIDAKFETFETMQIKTMRAINSTQTNTILKIEEAAKAGQQGITEVQTTNRDINSIVETKIRKLEQKILNQTSELTAIIESNKLGCKNIRSEVASEINNLGKTIKSNIDIKMKTLENQIVNQNISGMKTFLEENFNTLKGSPIFKMFNKSRTSGTVHIRTIFDELEQRQNIIQAQAAENNIWLGAMKSKIFQLGTAQCSNLNTNHLEILKGISNVRLYLLNA